MFCFNVVIERIVNLCETWGETCFCLVFRQDGIAPNFIQKPVTKQADNGKKLLFECQLTADPAPQITWFRDEQQITPGGEFTSSLFTGKLGVKAVMSMTYLFAGENF